MRNRIIAYALLLFAGLLSYFLFGSLPLTHADPHDATVVFGVTWYDVGKAALEGLPGVKKVTSGWHGFMEANTVIYDSSRITIEQMEDALRKAGTYRKTFSDNWSKGNNVYGENNE